MSQIFSEHAIRDGITLLHHRSDKWKTDLLKVFFVAPLDAATPSRSLGSYLLRHGPQRLGGMSELSRELKETYGSALTAIAGRSVNNQVITLRAKTVARRHLPRRPDTLRRMLGLLDDTLQQPQFRSAGFSDEAYVLEQQNLIRAIRSQDDQPSGYASRELMKMLFGDHALARRVHGGPQDVAALGVSQVSDDISSLVQAAPCFIYAITDRSGDDVAELVSEKLSLNARGALSKSRLRVPLIKKRAKSAREARPIAQARIAMGFRIEGYSRRSDRFAAYMGDFILGGGSTSRLFRIVREKHSLAYSIGSSFDDASGTIYVTAGIEPSSEARVRRLVQAQVKHMATHDADPEAMALALTCFRQSLIGFQDSQDQLIGFDSMQKLKGLRVRTPDQVMASHRRVRAADVAGLFGRLKLDSVFTLGPDGGVS